ncbi:methanogenesis marker 8 protein [Methanobrevibacter millerae]|uniref:Putative methanogenesis marker protein 8 n=1 Tax=Methanobrevibacter millerae TaxID=230361 RepID=A0A1G5X831_9EURY|nr:methanogenesis marker 8 protein [Methanobrevibacter millerae]SDA66096.1 putative methanogenesis marker protein 8 [Methanobrevibacter millerae]
MNDRHVIEALGKAEVVIENGKITYIGEPVVDYCSIFDNGQHNGDLTKEFIKSNINKRIDEFGMCTPQRSIDVEDTMSFGTSETLKTNMINGNVDCVVGACEGVGTLLIDDAELVQGVGGRVSALISTTPIYEVMDKVGRENVLNPENAELNPLKGLEMAIERGYKNIAITIIPTEMVKDIRQYPKPEDVNIYIFVAHTTNVSKKEADMLFDYADVISGCSSINIRETAEERKPYYAGKKVPLYAVTENGKRLLNERLEYIGYELCEKKYPQDFTQSPKPLI